MIWKEEFFNGSPKNDFDFTGIFCNIALLFREKTLTAMNLINFVEKDLAPVADLPEFKSGDTVTVHYKIKEGEKMRIQQFQGVVLQRNGAGHTETFTVRKVSDSIGVERIFPVASPFIDKVEVNKRGRVRRARIFYLRDAKGKKARIKEKKR